MLYCNNLFKIFLYYRHEAQLFILGKKKILKISLPVTLKKKSYTKKLIFLFLHYKPKLSIYTPISRVINYGTKGN